MINLGDGILPQKLLIRDLPPEEALWGTHVTVGQLVPGLREGLLELVRMLVESFRYLSVIGILLERQIRREHHRGLTPRRIVGIGCGSLGLLVLRCPLVRAGWTLIEFPVVAE